MPEGLIPIHLPLNDGSALVYIQQGKTYGSVPAAELIQNYHRPERNTLRKKLYTPQIRWHPHPHMQGIYTSNDNTMGKGKTSDVFKLSWIPNHIQRIETIDLVPELPPTIQLGKTIFDTKSTNAYRRSKSSEADM